MSTNVTDRILLKKIYDTYYQEFCDYEKAPESRDTKILVPIDCKVIAKHLKLDPNLVFGRLYYHLDKKYGYKREDGSHVSLFSLQSGSDRHTVNFPLLAAVLAELEQSYYRFTLPLFISAFALFISVAAYITANT
jgi:hypothetical protein